MSKDALRSSIQSVRTRICISVGVSLVIHGKNQRFRKIHINLGNVAMNEEDRKGIVKNASDDHIWGQPQRSLLLGSTKAVQALGLSRAQLFFLLRIIINSIAGRSKRFRRGSGVRLSGRDSENDRSDDGEQESEPWDDSHQPHYRKSQQQNPFCKCREDTHDTLSSYTHP